MARGRALIKNFLAKNIPVFWNHVSSVCVVFISILFHIQYDHFSI